MRTDWLNIDIGAEWRKYEDKNLLAEEIRIAFLELQKIFWKNKPKNYRYYDVISTWFHDGNRDCGWIMNYKSGDIKYATEKSLWTTLYRVFNYLQWSYALMELTNLLERENN